MNAKLISTIAFAAFSLFASAGAASADPDVDFGFSINGGGVSIELGTGGFHDGSVCFYKNSWYAGGQRCYDAGESRSHLNGNWNDKISSLELSGGASVTVCTGANFTGNCHTYHNDKGNLPNAFNNKISSFQVF